MFVPLGWRKKQNLHRRHTIKEVMWILSDSMSSSVLNTTESSTGIKVGVVLCLATRSTVLRTCSDVV